MRHIFIVFLLLIIAIKSNGQAICPPYGISTNPDNAYNNQFPTIPSKKNTFDWRTRTYTFNYNNEPTPRILPSPFYDATPNVGFPTKLVIIKDMKPEDGWELLSREFGYENDNITKKVIQVQYPMLILYNRPPAKVRMV